MKDKIYLSQVWTEAMNKCGEDLTHPFADLMGKDNKITMNLYQVADELGVTNVTARKRVKKGLKLGFIKKSKNEYFVNPNMATLLSPDSSRHNELIERWVNE